MSSLEIDVQTTKKPNIFISHSHKDQIYARKVLAWLERVGFNPWASFEECSDLYRIEIDNALLRCDVFLFIASKNSFESVEVRREINTAASLSKPISYYKIDESSHNREGFLTLLSEKQYVQASKENLELDKLAINAYEAFDGNKDMDAQKIRANIIKNSLIFENENYFKWREKLWSLRIDRSNNARKLSSFDRDVLQREADQLGVIISIDDENQAFSLNKQSFSRDLIGIVAKRRIDKTMLAQIEKKRLECSVPKSLALSILARRLNKIEYLNHISISKGAEKTDHWLVTEIKNARQNKQVWHDKGEDLDRPQTLPNKHATLKATAFRFRHRICFLERYVNGASDAKMHVLLIESTGHQLEFFGIKGMTPFSLIIPESTKGISSGSDFIRLHQAGLETYILLRVDRTTEDFGALLEYLTRLLGTVAHDFNSTGVPEIKSYPIEATANHGLTKINSSTGTPKLSVDRSTSENLDINDKSNEPDTFFYGLIVFAGILLISFTAIRGLYNAVLSLMSGHH